MPQFPEQEDEILAQTQPNNHKIPPVGSDEEVTEDSIKPLDTETETEATEAEGDGACDPAEDAEGIGDDENAVVAAEDDRNTTDKTISFVYDLTELFAISFAIVMIILCFFLRQSDVSGSSMEKTIQNGDKLLVSNIAYTPEQGDVVIVHSLHNLSTPLVKRVIAVGGDTVSINFSRWMIEVNGEIYEQRKDENGNDAKIGGDYVKYEEGYPMGASAALIQIGFKYNPETDTYTATVPEGHLFILGDNRRDSKDSRDPSVGFVDERLVVGKSSFRLAPFSKMGFLD
jgi:signal peptidase I